jgi:hypothetical protein
VAITWIIWTRREAAGLDRCSLRGSAEPIKSLPEYCWQFELVDQFRELSSTNSDHMDFHTSTQVGLPRIIKDPQCDTRLPQNLHDGDLDSGHDVLPPARPLIDPTPLSSIIQQSLVIKVAAGIYDATETGPPSPAILFALTSRLQEAIGSIPGRSRYRPSDETIGDGPASSLDRIHRDTIW